jgi:hypothetical protein
VRDTALPGFRRHCGNQRKTHGRPAGPATASPRTIRALPTAHPAYLQACAVNGSKAPEQLERWLPWNFIHHDAGGVQEPPVSSQARAP